jgi:WD40 repeat protein
MRFSWNARFSAATAASVAVSDQNDLVLWHWEANKHQRIDVGRTVGSLVFSPDGRFLAEGPTPGQTIEIRDLQTQKVVQTWANSTKRSMNIPTLAYAQGGRVLIACDNIPLPKKTDAPHRIHLWDLEDGSLAQELALPTGLPQSFDISPNGRYLVTMLEENNQHTLSVWRLNGERPETDPGPTSPATANPSP